MKLVALSFLLISCRTVYERDPQEFNEQQGVEALRKITSGEVNSFLKRLAPRLEACIERQDTSFSVFHGCMDWHSSVHAHFALLRISRHLNDKEIGKKVAARIHSMSGVEANINNGDFAKLENYYVSTYTHTEVPYGLSWFLLLVQEYDQWRVQFGEPENKSLKSLGNKVFKKLYTWFESNRSNVIALNEPSYENLSWGIYQLSNYAKFYNFKERVSLTSYVKKTFSKMNINRFLFLNDEVASSDAVNFFSPFGNFIYVLAKTDDSLISTFFEDRSLDPESLQPPSRGTKHELGLIWSRAWALKALSLPSSAVSTDAERAYAEHVKVGMERYESQSPADQPNYGLDHWIPQFAVYALTDGE